MLVLEHLRLFLKHLCCWFTVGEIKLDHAHLQNKIKTINKSTTSVVWQLHRLLDGVELVVRRQIGCSSVEFGSSEVLRGFVVRQNSKIFGHETDSRGTESNNFLVAQPTTHYLLRSYPLLVGFSF